MTMRYLLAALALTAIATDSEAGPFRPRAQSAYQPTYQPVYEANSSVPSTPRPPASMWPATRPRPRSAPIPSTLRPAMAWTRSTPSGPPVGFGHSFAMRG